MDQCVVPNVAETDPSGLVDNVSYLHRAQTSSAPTTATKYPPVAISTAGAVNLQNIKRELINDGDPPVIGSNGNPGLYSPPGTSLGNGNPGLYLPPGTSLGNGNPGLFSPPGTSLGNGNPGLYSPPGSSVGNNGNPGLYSPPGTSLGNGNPGLYSPPGTSLGNGNPGLYSPPGTSLANGNPGLYSPPGTSLGNGNPGLYSPPGSSVGNNGNPGLYSPPGTSLGNGNPGLYSPPGTSLGNGNPGLYSPPGTSLGNGNPGLYSPPGTSLANGNPGLYSPCTSAATEVQSDPWYVTAVGNSVSNNVSDSVSDNVSMEDVHRAVCGFLAGTFVKREGEPYGSPRRWSDQTPDASSYRTGKSCDVINVARDVNDANYFVNRNLQTSRRGERGGTVVNSVTSHDSHSVSNKTLQNQSSQVVYNDSNQKEVSYQINNSVAKRCRKAPVDMSNVKSVALTELSLDELLGKRQQVDNSLVDTYYVRNNDSVLKCMLCLKTLNRKDKMQTHIRIHLGMKPFACSVGDCKESFPAWEGLRGHVKLHATRFQCSYCTRTFGRASNVRNHENVHTGNKPYKCKECVMCFHTNVTLRHHFLKHHESKKQCDMCGKTYSYAAFHGHMQIHHNTKRLYKCEICNKTFKYKVLFDDHMRWHKGEELYLCGICSKGFENRVRLRNHMKRHSQQRRLFKCSKCDKSFAAKHYLDGHLNLHDGIKKHCCQVCGSTFSHKHYLVTHMKSHGEKKFVCAICGGKFNRKDNLKSHIIRQHQAGKCKKKKKKK